MTWHYDETKPDVWSTPLGLSKSFLKKQINVDNYGYNPHYCNFSKIIDNSKNYDFIFVCVAGPSSSFDVSLNLLKNNVKCPVFLEAGDDVPFSNFHEKRVNIVDAIFTPDKRCHEKYKTKNLNSTWMPSWCDDEIFYYKSKNRENICVTTCGERPYVNVLANSFPKQFLNKRVWFYDNTDFYNQGTVVYQYARYDEITRRLFEAGGCHNALLTNRISKETGIYDLFPEDECICYFSSESECIDKMKKLFHDDEYRNNITKNLYETIQKNHMVSNRVDLILKEFYKL